MDFTGNSMDRFTGGSMGMGRGVAGKPDGIVGNVGSAIGNVAGGAAEVKPIGAEQLKQFTTVLRKYKAGREQTTARIVAAEQWWKLRNTAEERKKVDIGADGGFASVSAWLHNVIVSKHADAIESYPEPNILPREEGDKTEAKLLSAIIPCILEQNEFDSTYSDAMWSKIKFGTGCYKVVWDKSMLGGLGDIRVDAINLLNVYWEPGIKDIQRSRYLFQTELVDKDILIQKHPELEGKLIGNELFSTRFLYDDAVDTTGKTTVVEVYYHVWRDGKKLLHYCKYVGDQVLYATENETQGVADDMGNQIAEPMAQTGLYDHGEYPYVFDPLFPIEGSPCGYGFVDLGCNPQVSIDLLNTAFLKNAMVGSIPRYITSQDAKLSEKEFLDTSKPIIHINGSVDETTLRSVPHQSLDSNYLNLMDRRIQEMRETTGNTETSTGNIQSGVTAASAIAALQEAAGKGSRDSNQASYRAYAKIVKLCIELVRQFYDFPRKFRIVGEMGMQQFVEYSNANLMQQQVGVTGDMGFRKAEFDIKVYAQKKTVYTKISNNETALEFFRQGFFNPQMAEQALMCLDMMDFDGKDVLMQKVSRNAKVFQMFAFYAQQCLMMAQATGNMALAQQAAMDCQQYLGGVPSTSTGGEVQLWDSTAESSVTRNAREQTSNATKPKEG